MMRAIQGFEKNILFDTVEKGDILMKNMDQMNIDPRDIQTLFISHDHYDHTGGIETLISRGSIETISLIDSFPDPLKPSRIISLHAAREQ